MHRVSRLGRRLFLVAVMFAVGAMCFYSAITDKNRWGDNLLMAVAAWALCVYLLAGQFWIQYWPRSMQYAATGAATIIEGSWFLAAPAMMPTSVGLFPAILLFVAAAVCFVKGAWLRQHEKNVADLELDTANGRQLHSPASQDRPSADG